MNTFLVTGATGFLGSALTERLLNNGYKVIGTGRREKGFLSDEILGNENFTFLKADLSGDCSDSLRRFNVDGIFHLASQQPSFSNLAYGDFYKGNVETALSLINFTKVKKLKFIVYTSTGSIFGRQPNEKYINENSRPTPTTYYGLTKYIVERLLDIELKNTETKVVIIRYPSLFGKSYSGGVVYTYYKSAKKGQNIELYSKGQRYRNLLYVRDAVDILLKVIKNVDKLERFEVFTVGSRNSLRMKEIAQIIKKLLLSDSKIIPVDKRCPTDWDVFIDISKAQRTLNFNPMTIEEGLESYTEQMRSEV
jgi:UDP-glucose 4-epimerase